VDRYRAGLGQLEEIFEGVGIRAPTQPQTEAARSRVTWTPAGTSPSSERVQVTRQTHVAGEARGPEGGGTLSSEVAALA